MDILGEIEAALNVAQHARSGTGSWFSAAPAAPAPGRFEACLAFTWLPQFDGQPLHTTPHDAGGATAWGVTLATYAAWRAKHGEPSTTVEDLRAATKDQLAELIRAEYWNALQGDHLPAGVDLLVYDFGYGSGAGTSARKLQEVLGVTVDGQLGPHTLAAAQAFDREALIRKLNVEHETFYRGLRDFQYFGHGWTNRNDARLTAALATL